MRQMRARRPRFSVLHIFTSLSGAEIFRKGGTTHPRTCVFSTSHKCIKRNILGAKLLEIHTLRNFASTKIQVWERRSLIFVIQLLKKSLPRLLRASVLAFESQALAIVVLRTESGDVELIRRWWRPFVLRGRQIEPKYVCFSSLEGLGDVNVLISLVWRALGV